MNSDPNLEKLLFNEALEFPEAERATYFKGACRGPSEHETSGYICASEQARRTQAKESI